MRTPSGRFRELTVEEYRRAQGFPEEYPLEGLSEHKAFSLIGNAEPPVMAQAYAARALKFLQLVKGRQPVELGLRPTPWTAEQISAARSFAAWSSEEQARFESDAILVEETLGAAYQRLATAGEGYEWAVDIEGDVPYSAGWEGRTNGATTVAQAKEASQKQKVAVDKASLVARDGLPKVAC